MREAGGEEIEHRRVAQGVPVVDASGSDHIAATCLELLDDRKARKSIGDAGRRYVLRHHDLPPVAGELVRLYEELR